MGLFGGKAAPGQRELEEILIDLAGRVGLVQAGKADPKALDRDVAVARELAARIRVSGGTQALGSVRQVVEADAIVYMILTDARNPEIQEAVRQMLRSVLDDAFTRNAVTSPPPQPTATAPSAQGSPPREACGVSGSRSDSVVVPTPRLNRKRKTLLLGSAALIVVAAVTSALLLLANPTGPNTMNLTYPLQIYPVAQTSPGQCLPGTQGITGPGPFCYQVTEGIVLRRLASIRPQHDSAAGYSVVLTLTKADISLLAALTRANVGNNLALVDHERLVTVSRVDAPVLDGRLIISASSQTDADRIARNIDGEP